MAHISEAGVKMICEICDRYANEKTPLMMILSDIQNEYGYIPLDVQQIVSEKTGISEEVMQQADEFMRIPMCGMVESLNVSACAAIIVYMLSQRMRSEVADWNLTAQEQAHILYRWMVDTVKDAPALLLRGGFQ